MRSSIGPLLILASGVSYGAFAPGAQILSRAGMSSYEILIFPFLVGLVYVLPLVAMRFRLFNKRALKFYGIYGLINLGTFLAPLMGIALGVSVGVVVLLFYTQPLWSVLFGKILLHEPITKQKALANFVAISGIVFLAEPWTGSLLGNPWGMFVSLLGGVFLALWIVMGRKGGLNRFHPVMITFHVRSFTVVWALLTLPLLAALLPLPNLTGFDPANFQANFMFILGYAIVTGPMADMLFYKGVVVVPASVAGVLMLAEPVSAILIAAVFLSQAITLNLVIAAGLILLSNYLILRKS
ncbi:MAG: DMT family transporter [Candidatus Bathyarchaeia archaeon]